VRILAIDAGSSSVKYAFFDVGGGEGRERFRGSIEGLSAADDPARAGAIRAIVALLRERDAHPDAIGHRVVFGGADHVQPERVGDALLAALHGLATADPLHGPIALEAMMAMASAYPGLPQVACFDTAFHAGIPEVARRFALPRDTYPEMRRYGYHGLSYEYVIWKLGDMARGRIVVGHLGNGASFAAVRDGEAIDTSMGFSTLGGIMMGTRSGDLDPGVVLQLLGNHEPDEVAAMLTQRSGLLGVSGRTADMRVLVEAMHADVAAAQAVGLFVFQARKWIGAMAAALDGLDRLVFTGGIGERSAAVRALICAGLTHLGVRLDGARNDAGAETISQDGARVGVLVVPTDEARMVARHTAQLLGEGFPTSSQPPRMVEP
jgi:acetate kinase